MIPADSLWLWAVLFGVVAGSLALDHFRIGRWVSAPLAALTAGMVLSNLGIIPSASASYDGIGRYVVAAAIPLLLFGADLRKIVRESGVTLRAFAVGAVCTAVAAVVAFLVIPVDPALGAQLAGVFTATYIGGSMNLIATGQAVNLTGDPFAAAVAADNLVGTLYIALLALLPSLGPLRRRIEREKPAIPVDVRPVEQPPPQLPPSDAWTIGAIALALAISALSSWVSALVGAGHLSVLFATAFAVLVATFVPGIKRVSATSFELGLVSLMLFFVTVGAAARLDVLLAHGMATLAFAALLVTVHIVMLSLLMPVFRLPLRETLIGSCSNITGPAVSATVCASNGWRDLIAPGILTGVLGYVIGTFAGVAITHLLAP